MSEKLRCGLIGCGWIAGAHADAYKKLENAELVAVADHTPAKAQAFCEAHGLTNVRIYPDHLSMLEAEELDLVSVCTANAAHASCSIDALRRGVSVSCEKPMSVTLEEAEAMCRAAEESGALLTVGFQPRYDVNMQLVRETVQSGVLGKIYYVQTGGGRRRGIPTPFGTSFIEKKNAGLGALGDIGCYSLDLVLNALGYPKPLTVSGYTSAYFGTDPAYYTVQGKPAEYAEKFTVDDFAAAFIRMEEGLVIDFRIAWAMNADTTGDTLFLGTKGGLRVPSTECWAGGLDKPLILYYEENGKQLSREIPLRPQNQDRFDRKIADFAAAVAASRRGEPFEVECPGTQILRNQAIIDAIERSARLGREVEVVLPEGF